MKSKTIESGRKNVTEAYSAERLIQVAVSLSREKEIGPMLDKVLAEVLGMTGYDGGAVLLRREDTLQAEKLAVKSRGVRWTKREWEQILPPVPLTGQSAFASAVRESRIARLSGEEAIREWDAALFSQIKGLEDYTVQFMQAVPMGDEKGGSAGVLCLFSEQDGKEDAAFFDPGRDRTLLALCSLAAVSLNNALLEKSIIDILHSFVTVMVDAIDARSPYNAKHSRSMVGYAARFLSWLDREDRGWRFSQEEKDPFLMSVWLHDLGKLVIPLEIMDKKTRMGRLEEGIMNRIQVGQLMERLRALEHPEQAQEARDMQARLAQARDTLLRANQAGELGEDTLDQLRQIGKMKCLNAEGKQIPLLTKAEMDAVSVRKGTLTAKERAEVQRHVVYTGRLLNKMRFSGIYEPVPRWAAAHHELLDGSGYPDHLTGEALPRPVRLMTILDIYDALTADDRPYKPPVTPEEAFSVLEEMAAEGKIDADILALFKESGAWKAAG